ncbi:MAG: hypothetical protein KU37_06845 [Sulfuricurvum sp. PC08-66]|nr:MAG: hypothetical protein KU37_06845 [Sulfuricurvum sp. PC08-66]
MRITYLDHTLTLDDIPLDEGYATERISVTDGTGATQTLGGQNGATQLLITLPFIDDAILEELRAIAHDLPHGGDYPVTASLIVHDAAIADPTIEGLAYYVDTQGEMGDFYSVRLSGAPLESALAKALFVVSKDGALYYGELLRDMAKPFNTATLARKIAAAQLAYTGKGCH